jgi:hypothetical protein
MLYIIELYTSFWAEGLQTACYLQNISYTSALIKTTPFELWTGLKPNLSHLRIFGCQAFSQIPNEKHTKLQDKALKCVFVGYGEPLGIKGYRLYHAATKRLFYSRDVIFSEDELLSSLQISCLNIAISPFDPDLADFYYVKDSSCLPVSNINL